MVDMKNLINIDKLTVVLNTLDYNYLFDDINKKVSVIIFSDNIENTQIEENNKINKLIYITDKKYNYRNKNIIVKNKITKSLLEKIGEEIIVIVKTNNNYNYMKQVIKNLVLLKELCEKLDIKLGVTYSESTCIGFIQNKEAIYYNDIINALKVIFLEDREEQYKFIYETVCNYLDTQFSKNNYCDFKNNACIANREKQNTHTTMGCCYSFEHGKFWSTKFIKNIQLCQHLNCKTCDTKCITCKMFTCDYLKKKQIQFDTNNILLLDCFFNKKQQLILKSNFFKTQEEILKKLQEKNHDIYLWYLCRKKYLV